MLYFCLVIFNAFFLVILNVIVIVILIWLWAGLGDFDAVLNDFDVVLSSLGWFWCGFDWFEDGFGWVQVIHVMQHVVALKYVHERCSFVNWFWVWFWCWFWFGFWFRFLSLLLNLTVCYSDFDFDSVATFPGNFVTESPHIRSILWQKTWIYSYRIHCRTMEDEVHDSLRLAEDWQRTGSWFCGKMSWKCCHGINQI